MRHHLHLYAFAFSTALMFGVAQAAPSFGSSSHRLGGDDSRTSKAARKDERPLSLLEMALSVAGVKLTTSVEPVAGERSARGTKPAKQCDKAETTEVAKADTKDGGEGGSTKARARSGEPVYLAF